MAIGTAAAIGLGLTAIGGIASASASKSAAKTAANAQTQASNQNAMLTREIYGQNQQALSPFMARGNAAGEQINALLGLGPQQAPQPANDQGTFNPAHAQAMGWSPEQARAYGRPESTGFDYGAPQSMGQPSAAPQSQQGAFDTFRNSTGYQFRLGEGMNALNSGLASAGVLQSGAAMKEAQRYGQDFASNEFGNYMGMLGNQQGVGLSGASALAGVGQNFANSMASFNNDAASAKGNAALIAGQNNFGNTLGMIGGGLFGYGRGK